MKIIVYIISAIIMVTSCGAGKRAAEVSAEAQVTEGAEYSSSTLIIMYDSEVGKEPLVEAVKAYGAEIIYDYSIIPGMAIKIPEGAEMKDAIEYFKGVKGVVSVERDRIYHLSDNEPIVIS